MTKSLRFSPFGQRALWSPWMLTGLALAGVTGCVQEPPMFDPKAAQDWELRQDNQVKYQPKQALPVVPIFPGDVQNNSQPDYRHVPEGPPLMMTLQEIIHRAMANNLEVRVASYDTAVDQTRIMEAEANFDPSIVSDINFQRIDKQTGGSEASVPLKNVSSGTNNATTAFRDIIVRYDEEYLYTSDVGLKQNLQSGGKIELDEQMNYSWFNPPRTLLKSYWENDLVLTLTQPVLQNYGVGVNRARIDVARNNARVSLMDFRKTVEDTVLKIEQVYWQQVQAVRDVRTNEELIQRSQDLYDILVHRFGTDVSNVEVAEAKAQLLSHKVTLIQLQAHVADLSDSLKQLMNDPSFPVVSSSIITPVDAGSENPLHFSLDDQIETAMQNRYELGQQQARIDSAEISVKVAENNLLPSLTAQVQATLDGLGHDIGSAFNEEGEFNHWGYQFGFQFEFPLGNRAARAIWQRSLLQRMQAMYSYTGLVNQIAEDVKTASRQVNSTYDRLAAARESRLFFQKLIEDLTLRVDKGDQTLDYNFVANLLQDETQLAQAEQTEHQALNDYNFAIATLEKNKGTILRYDNVIMEQEQLPFDMTVKGNAAAVDALLGTRKVKSEPPMMPIVPMPVVPTTGP